MDGHAASRTVFCRECGAESPDHATRCWLCQARLTPTEAIFLAEAVDMPAPPSPSELFFQFATLALLALVLLVGLGILWESPGAIVAYLVLVIPPLLGTMIHVAHHEKREGKRNWSRRFATLIISSAIMASLLAAVVVALLIAFFVYCITALATQ